MGHYLKKEVLEKANTFKKLSTVDLADKKKQKNSKHFDIGFAAQANLKKVTEKKAASELRIYLSQNECIKFLSAIVIKLLERCPLKYSLVQNLVSVVSQKLVSDSAEPQVKFGQLPQILLNGKWCLVEASDEILTQLKGFVLEMKPNHLAEFLSFIINADRLDEFYWNYMKDAKHSKVWKVFELSSCFCLVKLQSRGGFQSTVNFWLKTCKRKP